MPFKRGLLTFALFPLLIMRDMQPAKISNLVCEDSHEQNLPQWPPESLVEIGLARIG
jgi:hypothetical protein